MADMMMPQPNADTKPAGTPPTRAERRRAQRGKGKGGGRSQDRPSICLCMIVKNEAGVIRRCLDSVRPLIDHWIIVDTGSTDGTQGVVRAHLRDLPGELVERPWRDFAHNRSEALALARPHGDYSLIIDADDVLLAPQGFRMPALTADSYAVDVVFGTTRLSRPQMVRAALAWRYEGVLHEYLVCEAAQTSGHLPLTMQMSADGARRRDPETYKRDVEVLERALAQEADPFKLSRYTFYLAQSYSDAGEGGKALPLYLERAGMGFWDQEVYCSLLCAGRISETLGRPVDEVLALYRRATETCPGRAEAFHAGARLCRERRRFAEGLALAGQAAEKSAPPGGLFVESWIYDWGALDELAVNAYWAGDHRACAEASRRALDGGKVPEGQRARLLGNIAMAREAGTAQEKAHGEPPSSASRPEPLAVTGKTAGPSVPAAPVPRSPSERPTVCLCMIVKDEAPVIRRCLDSVRPLIDHWVIVDTGSTDGTQEVVREHFRDVPGELVERPWRDFAHNRSEALALARPHGDYSLIIDADDSLEVPDGYRLPHLDADSYLVDIHFGDSRYNRHQLVKASLGWRYEGVIHEYLVCEGASTSGHLPLVMRIHQDGARRRDPDTYKRDVAVLERAVAEETDPFKLSRYTFYLAQSYRDTGQVDKAIPLYLRRADMGFWDQEAYVSLLYAGRFSEGAGRPPADVEATYRRAIDLCPSRAEAFHAAARLLRGQKRFSEGCELARRAIDLEPPHLGLFLESWIYDYGMLDEYAVNAFWANRHRDSLDANLRALKRGKIPPDQLSHFLDNMRFALDRLPAEVQARTAAEPSPPAPASDRAGRAPGNHAVLPSAINLGSGKDFRDDHLNIDVDETWRPDAVVDLSAVTLGPDGIRLETRRFGEVVLRPGSVDRMIANDVLEHVPNLVALMTTCLGLLRVGGTFTISVPYDLSFGAWQDPTHVRTFNERSWLYYTDWFWYLGWRDARFVVDAMEHVASPLGATLRARDVPEEEVVRTPRAIDSMSVTLRKALLTPDDQRTLDHWRDRKRAAEARGDAHARPEAPNEVPPRPDAAMARQAAATPVPLAFSEPWDEARDAYCLWIVSPQGYEHRFVFDDVATVLSEAFAACGGSAPIVRSPDAWGGRTPIVLAPHLLTDAEASALPRGAVLYNFEQVDAASGWITPLYLSILKRFSVIDYSLRNTQALKAAGIAHVRHLALRAMLRTVPAGGEAERDIDVLFYGWPNERRVRILEELKARGLAVTHLRGVYGRERDAAVARAKVVINMHYYESAIFESARVCHLLSLGACVVSEGRFDDPDTADLFGGLVLCDVGDIVDHCLALVKDPAKRDEQARRGLAAIARRSQADILMKTFRGDPAQVAVPPHTVKDETPPGPGAAAASEVSPSSRVPSAELAATLRIARGDIVVCDVGAAFLGEPQLYQPLIDMGLGRLVCFEPDGAQIAGLRQHLGDQGLVLPFALGDGRSHTLHIAPGGMTSLLEPDQASYDLYTLFAAPPFSPVATSVTTALLETRCLDEVGEVSTIDLLKIDIQGSELMVLKNGERKLDGCSVIQIEMPFVPLYKGMPTFGEVDAELRRQGFMVHGFATLKRLPVHPYSAGDPAHGINQLVDLDMIYVRDLRYMDRHSDESLRKIAMIADACYQSFDVAQRCIAELVRRGTLAVEVETAYAASRAERRRTGYIHMTPMIQTENC